MKNYSVRKTEKLLGELDTCRNTLDYLLSLSKTPLPLSKAETVRRRIRYLSRTLEAVEHALGLLDPLERTIIEQFFFHRSSERSVDDICAMCTLEKSSVYRYRARALARMAAALYGG